MDDINICAWTCIAMLTVSLMKDSVFAGVVFFIMAAYIKRKCMGKG